MPQAGLGRRARTAGVRRIIGPEDRQHAVADQLQHFAARFVDRGDDRIGVVVEQRDDLVGRGGVGDPGVAVQVGEPEHRADRSATPREMRPLSTRWPASRPR